MDHAVAEEWEVRALRVELRIGSVAVIGAGQRVRDAAHDLQLEVVLAAHRRKQADIAGWMVCVSATASSGCYGVNVSLIYKRQYVRKAVHALAFD